MTSGDQVIVDMRPQHFFEHIILEVEKQRRRNMRLLEVGVLRSLYKLRVPLVRHVVQLSGSSFQFLLVLQDVLQPLVVLLVQRNRLMGCDATVQEVMDIIG